MRLSFGKILFLGVSAIVLSFAVYQIFSIKNSVQKTLAEENARLKNKKFLPFEKKILSPHSFQNIRILQSASDTRDFVKFKNSFFAATGGGLVEFDDAGKILKHFTVLDGLPESDLTALAVFQDKLFIGTRTKNLVVFDGKTFENYVLKDREIQTVTAFLEMNGELFIGTSNGGLLKYDGANFTEIQVDEERIKAITCLQKSNAKLFVGTFDSGLWIYEADVWTHFTIAENLPSNRVVGIAVRNKNVYVAADFGLAILQEKTFRSLAVLTAVSSLIFFDNQIFLTRDNGDFFAFEQTLKELSDRKNLQKARIVATNEKLFLLSNQGISEINKTRIKSFSPPENNALTDNFVSALTFDSSGNLWVGTFRSGIDVFSADGKKLKHIESETGREINFLNADKDTVSAATSAGLLAFKKNFAVENLTKNENLPSNSIWHFSGDLTATAKGLAIRADGQIRVLSTVQNLPSNSIYTTLRVGEKTYAGTLGGLAEIEKTRVVRTFKDSNSDLKTNWVTALLRANERIFIGTYGGGIFELLPSGEIRSFEAETGKFVVNPNAFFSDGERLYAGTLTGAKILDLQTQSWQTIKNVLPSETVMSITGDAENIYFGTSGGIARIGKNYFTNGDEK